MLPAPAVCPAPWKMTDLMKRPGERQPPKTGRDRLAPGTRPGGCSCVGHPRALMGEPPAESSPGRWTTTTRSGRGTDVTRGSPSRAEGREHSVAGRERDPCLITCPQPAECLGVKIKGQLDGRPRRASHPRGSVTQRGDFHSRPPAWPRRERTVLRMPCMWLWGSIWNVSSPI